MREHNYFIRTRDKIYQGRDDFVILKDQELYIKHFQDHIVTIADIIEQALKEYEQYKAIEEELGIDLITLFKAISNGVWVKTKNDISKHLTVALKKRHPTKTYWLFYRPYSHVYLEDYGKTWALTREELEK